MNHRRIKFTWIILVMALGSCNQLPDLGIFEGNNDIGDVKYAGSVEFDPADSSYAVSGGGTNMWFSSDELHLADRVPSMFLPGLRTVNMLHLSVIV